MANKLHKKLMSVHQAIKQAEGWEELREIIQHPDDSVKLWTATFY